MNGAIILIIGLAILVCGYIFYGGWLAKQWGVQDTTKTPSHELEDGMDYCPRQGSRSDGTSLFLDRRRRPHQRPDSGRRVRLGPCYAVGPDRRHLLRRRSMTLARSVRL